MRKSIDKRFAYYTKKVAGRFSHHPANVLPPNLKNRNKRLLKYKSLMHSQM